MDAGCIFSMVCQWFIGQQYTVQSAGLDLIGREHKLAFTARQHICFNKNISEANNIMISYYNYFRKA